MRYCSADLSAFFFPVDTLSDGADDGREAEVFSWVVTVLPLVLEVIRFVELTGVLLAKESVHPQIEAVRTALVKRIAKSFLRVYLKTPNAPGQRAFLRCAASFFLEIRQYSCEKMSCATQKSLAAGHIMSFQIHPKEKQEDGSVDANSGTSKADAAGLSRADGLYGVFVWLQLPLPVLP